MIVCLSSPSYLPPPTGGGGPGISFTSDFTSTSVASGNIITNVPANTVDGDFLLFIGCVRGTVSFDYPFTNPGGWTTIHASVDGSLRVSNIHVAYKRASSEPGSYTWTVDSAADVGGGVMWRLTGVVGSGDPTSGTPVATHDNTAGSVNWTATGMTTADANAGVVGCHYMRNTGFTVTAQTLDGSAFPELIEIPKIAICAQIQAAAGATGTFEGTDGEDNDRSSLVFALKPA